MRASSFCGVILAAGVSSRMGRDKALLPWPPETPARDRAPSPGVPDKPGSGLAGWPPGPASHSAAKDDWFSYPAPAGVTGTFLSAQIKLLQAFTEMVIVVAGQNANALAPVVYALGAYLVKNPAPERGQFSSLLVGVQEVLSRGRDAAILTLVDRPPAQPATVQKIREVFCASDPAETWAVVPACSGRHGHPIVVGREMITAFLQAPEASTAREVEHASQARILYVPVEDPNIAVNINTPEDYAALAR